MIWTWASLFWPSPHGPPRRVAAWATSRGSLYFRQSGRAKRAEPSARSGSLRGPPLAPASPRLLAGGGVPVGLPLTRSGYADTEFEQVTAKEPEHGQKRRIPTPLGSRVGRSPSSLSPMWRLLS